jgi:predicted urease superfamily metal-dependent hydrolase
VEAEVVELIQEMVQEEQADQVGVEQEEMLQQVTEQQEQLIREVVEVVEQVEILLCLHQEVQGVQV